MNDVVGNQWLLHKGREFSVYESNFQGIKMNFNQQNSSTNPFKPENHLSDSNEYFCPDCVMN